MIDADRGSLFDGAHVLLATQSFFGGGGYGPGSRLLAPPAEQWSLLPEQLQQDSVDWDFSDEFCPLSLVDPKRLDEARVHAWAKFARSAELPPVLLWWRGERHAHRRPTDVAVVNRALIEAFDDRPAPSWRTTAWPLAGGVARWSAQVREELRNAGLSDDDSVMA